MQSSLGLEAHHSVSMTSLGSRLRLLSPLLTVPLLAACAEEAPTDESSVMVTPSSTSSAPGDDSASPGSTMPLTPNGSTVASNGNGPAGGGAGNVPNGPSSSGPNTPAGLGGSNGSQGGNNGSQGGEVARGGAPSEGGATSSAGGPSQGGASFGGAAATAGNGAGGGPSLGGSGGESQQGAGCSNASLLLCEDFEAAPLGGIPEGWTAEGDVEVTADGHSSQQALRSNAQPNWRRVIRHDASSFGAEHWGRIYYRVQMPVTTAFVHSTFAAFTGDGPTIGAAEYRVVDTVKSETDGSGNHTHQFLWNVQIDGAGEFGLGSDYDWSFDDQWHCAEWFVSATTQAYRFFIDGEEVTQIQIENGPGNYGENSNSRTDIPDQFNEFWVGFTNYQDADPGFVAWIDDVAIGTARVGCN